MEGKTKLNNRLWKARHKIGLEQKQVARLLGHKTCDQISRYERGSRLPGFKTAVKLTILYGVSLEEIFPEHYKRFNLEIQTKAEAFVASLNNGIKNKPANSNTESEASASLPLSRESSHDSLLCHYARLLENPSPSKTELEAVRKHAIKLIRTMTYL
jgi:transcriptional regulator with XRE-family HTH domain